MKHMYYVTHANVHLLRVVSDVVVVNINKRAYRNRKTKSGFRSKQSSGGKLNGKVMLSHYDTYVLCDP
jgi:hypothetical protein